MQNDKMAVHRKDTSAIHFSPFPHAYIRYLVSTELCLPLNKSVINLTMKNKTCSVEIQIVLRPV